jgi:uncharacterized membrane protein YfcA
VAWSATADARGFQGACVISLLDSAALLLAGAAAGLIGSAGGITSLVSYPALLAVGLPALSANIVNNVALIACWPGSALGSRTELHERGAWVWRWAPVAAVGAATGSALLLCTPSDVFSRVVPFLVAIGSLALLFESRLRAWRKRHGTEDNKLALTAGLIALSIYNGYFGAGAGVMTLTLTLVLVDRHLPTANALKNMLIGAGTAASAVLLALFGSVDWSAAVPLAVGMLAGSRVGPPVTRRIPAGLLRWLISLLGMGLAIYLWLHERS